MKSRRRSKGNTVAAVAAADAAFTFVLTLNHRTENVLSGILIAIFCALLATAAFGIHLVRLETRLAALERERDTQRRIREAAEK